MEKKLFKQYSAQWTYLTDEDIEADNKRKGKSYEKVNDNGVEIYQTNENYKPLEVEVKFYKNDQYIYSKNKNSYRTQHDKFMLLEWFDTSEANGDDKTLLIFNEDHAMISVYDADSGVKIHNTIDCADTFITNFKFFDDREYLYISGWVWAPFPTRELYHVPTMLKTPDYEPDFLPCPDADDSENRLNPSITLFGCGSCKELLEKKDQIREKMYKEAQTKHFNKNRLEDILLKRFIDDENKDFIEFNDNTKSLLENILSNDRKEFRIDVYGNGSGRDPLELTHEGRDSLELTHEGQRLMLYDRTLYSKAYSHDISYDEDKKMIFGKETDFNKILARTVFHQIEHHPFDVIDLRFEVYSDVGNFNIYMSHKLVLSDEFKLENKQENKQQNENVSENSPDDYYQMCVKRNKYKIDITTPIKIVCKSS